ncbi:MAG: MAPEG family protein [Pseudomonadota bacterium]
MTQETIFLPMIALAALTFTVLGLIPQRRFRSVFAKETTPDDYRLGESANVPGHVSIPNRNYMNLLEVPALFYVVCGALFVTGLVDAPSLGLAWAFVAARAAHSLVHVTYNRVIHRLVLFGAGNVILMALWLRFAIRIWPAATG